VLKFLPDLGVLSPICIDCIEKFTMFVFVFRYLVCSGYFFAGSFFAGKVKSEENKTKQKKK